MADYRLSIDLMQCIGSQLVNLKVRPRKEGESDEDYAKVPVLQYAAIPVAYNDIDVRQDTHEEQYRTYSGYNAYMGITDRQSPNDSKLIQSVRRRLMQNGEAETPYNVPCRDVRHNFRKEKEDALRSRYAQQLKAQHPEWATLEDQGRVVPRGTERNELTRAISAKMHYNLGNGYAIERSGYQPTVSAPIAQQVSGYTQQQTYDAPTEPTYDTSEEDLPF